MDDTPKFWFGAKRYGYGWGLPVRWQGWAVSVAYVALLIGGVYYFRQRPGIGLVVYVVVLTAVLVAVIAVKGERPLRWRWGKD